MDSERKAALVARVLRQGEELEALVTRAHAALQRRRVRDGGRVFHCLQDSFAFRENEDVSGDLTFNVPMGHSFEGVRLSMYPEVRLISIDGTLPSDVSWRPAPWATHGAYDPAVHLIGVDAYLELSHFAADNTQRAYQNVPFPASQIFCGEISDNVSEPQSSPSALVFEVPMLLAPGTTMQVRVTPTYSGRWTTDARIAEYRITAILEGFKRI